MRTPITIGAALVFAAAALGTGLWHTAGARAAQPQVSQVGMMGMGPVHYASRKAFWGYYDSHIDVYYSTDVSDKTQARMLGINFSPALRMVGATPAIYLVEGPAAANQIAVFGSEPGSSDYSPLWHEVTVRWKPKKKPVLLTSDNQILDLAKKGTLTATTMMHTIVNCPIIHVGKGA